MSNNTELLTEQLRAVLATNEIEASIVEDFDYRRLTFVYLSRTSIDKNEIDILRNQGFDVKTIMMGHIETSKYNWNTCMQLLIRAIDTVEVQ